MLAINVFLVLVALSAGASIYAGVAEIPARMRLDDRAALIHWQRSYRRARFVHAALASASFAVGAVLVVPMAGDLSSMRAAYFAAAIIMLASWPWTLLAMRATDRTLLSTPPEAANEQTRRVLRRWNGLHAVRTVSILVALSLILLAPFMGLVDVSG